MPTIKTDLADQHVEHHRRGHRAELLEPVVDAPQRAQADPFAADGDEQHRGLGEHAQRGADAEHQQLGVAHLDGVDRKLAGHKRDTAPSVAIATTLLTTGAQAGGPNTLRVFRIAMNTEDRP